MSEAMTRQRRDRIEAALYRIAILADAKYQKLPRGTAAWKAAIAEASNAHADYMAFTECFPVVGQSFVPGEVSARVAS